MSSGPGTGAAGSATAPLRRAEVGLVPGHPREFIGRRRHWKKAYVALKPGQEINFAAGEVK